MELDTIGKYDIEGDIHNQAYNAQEKKCLFETNVLYSC